MLVAGWLGCLADGSLRHCTVGDVLLEAAAQASGPVALHIRVFAPGWATWRAVNVAAEVLHRTSHGLSAEVVAAGALGPASDALWSDPQCQNISARPSAIIMT